MWNPNSLIRMGPAPLPSLLHWKVKLTTEPLGNPTNIFLKDDTEIMESFHFLTREKNVASMTSPIQIN